LRVPHFVNRDASLLPEGNVSEAVCQTHIHRLPFVPKEKVQTRQQDEHRSGSEFHRTETLVRFEHNPILMPNVNKDN
jgi:hypothetical protein